MLLLYYNGGGGERCENSTRNGVEKMLNKYSRISAVIKTSVRKSHCKKGDFVMSFLLYLSIK